MISCLSDSKLEQLRADDLPTDQTAAAIAHLQNCPKCAARDRALASQLENLLKNLRVAVRDTTIAAETSTSLPDVTRSNGNNTTYSKAAAPMPSSEQNTLSVHADQIPGYKIVREIQAGGQGVVYEATQLSTNKRVAIKVVCEGPFADPVNRARLERGMRILAQLDHPNIVGIIDSGTAGGTFYYVMDYIEGQSLDQFAARLRTSVDSTSRSGSRRNRLSTESLLRLFLKICEVVHAAHLRGIVHRDLKPGNIRVDPNGEPHLLDFDLAKIMQGDTDVESPAQVRTITGQFLGTLAWASPEQAEGNPSKIDVRTDVYSLGVILYQLLTGCFPYDVAGNLRDVLDSILRAEPAKPSTSHQYINDEVETIVLKCLAKERDRRYQSAGALADDLRRYLSGEPVLAKRASALYLLRKLAVRHAYATVLLLLVLCTMISASFISYYFYRSEKKEAVRNEAIAAQAVKQSHLFENLARTVQDQANRMACGWFLLEWHADRLQRAKQISDQMPKGTVEAEAMRFLLDSSIPDEEFLAQLPVSAASFGYWIVGERHLKANRRADAIRSFEFGLRQPNENWLHATIQARIQQLRQVEGTTQATKSP